MIRKRFESEPSPRGKVKTFATFYFHSGTTMKTPRSKLRGIKRKSHHHEKPRFLKLFPLSGNPIASYGESIRLTLTELARKLHDAANARPTASDSHREKTIVAQRIASDILARVEALTTLGLGYLSLERSTPTLSPGELQRLRLATQIRSQLFGVVYVLDEPSAGLHPADTQALLDALDELKRAGNSLFVVEHDLSVIRHADWIVDIGPDAGTHGGEVIYNSPLDGLCKVTKSHTSRYLLELFPNKLPDRLASKNTREGANS